MAAENELIARLARRIPFLGRAACQLGLRVGIGDDAAIFRWSAKMECAISCDASLEGVHFRDGVYPPESIGYKSLARAASDLAAMGARPRYFLLALALPSAKTNRWLDRFASGMACAARELHLRLIGGDISKNPGVMISITVLGEIAPGRALTRSGARPGDLIYVSGPLGAAQLGLELVLRGFTRRKSLAKYVQPHLYPKILLALGEKLVSGHIASAMMDISDGLSTDLARLCQASGVGARLWSAKIPAIKIPAALSKLNFDPLEFALHGGEDYVLLFTAPPRASKSLARISSKMPVRCIGEITRGRKILLVRNDGTASPLPALGWDHFRSRSQRPRKKFTRSLLRTRHASSQ